jgi:hypothetical protein
MRLGTTRSSGTPPQQELSHHVHHGGRSGDEVRERLESVAQVVAQKVGTDSAGLAVPAGILGHPQNETDAVALPFELLELVEEGRGLAVAVR